MKSMILEDCHNFSLVRPKQRSRWLPWPTPMPTEERQ
uniref:Uncharacterized protein n=1 Tax=Trichinella nativa TaxID=6335 RepID=A0A0V1KIT7_9BILA